MTPSIFQHFASEVYVYYIRFTRNYTQITKRVATMCSVLYALSALPRKRGCQPGEQTPPLKIASWCSIMWVHTNSSFSHGHLQFRLPAYKHI